MHKFYAPVKIDGELFIAKMTVDESHAPGKNDTNKKFYHVRSIEIETEPSVGIGKSHTPIMESTVSTIKVSQLYEYVKKNDKDFTPARESNPILLNEDGTPMTVYRGRNRDYTVFDRRMIRKRDDGIEGFFFAPPARRESVAAYYGNGETAAFYLSLKNPLVVATDERIDASRARGYDGIYGQITESMTEDEAEQVILKYLEEMFADAYAGLQRARVKTDAAKRILKGQTDAVRRAEENKRATRDTRGAPEERYSLTKDEDIEEENIRNGEEALKQMSKMAEYAENPEDIIIENAMYRSDIGQIDFVWGKPGTGTKFKGGYGISHIVAKHGEDEAQKVVEILAKGTEYDKQRNNSTKPNQYRLRVFYDGHTAVLSKDENRNHWLLTAWNNEKETAAYATVEGNGSIGATAATPTHTRRNGVDTAVSKPSLSNEGEIVKQKLSFDDEDYLLAVEAGDMDAAQEMVNEAARKAGYVNDSDWRMDHKAPNAKYDVPICQADVLYGNDGSIYSNKAAYYYGDGRSYDQKAIRVLKAVRDNPEARITVYRAVPNNRVESHVRNGDWVTITQEYAEEHGERALNGEYRIIKNDVPAKYVYANGDSIHEYGYDDGADYAYQNTENNRKLLDAVTYDDKGRIIPISERFNQEKTDIRYSIDEDFEADIDSWEEAGRPEGEAFILGSTGEVLQGLGAIESDIYMQGDKIQTILQAHPEMTLDEIKKIPQILEDPVLILKSRNVGRENRANTRIVIFGSVKAQDGKPVLTVLDLRPVEQNLVIDDMQKVTSAYTKDHGVRFAQSSDVIYADKKRTAKLLRTIGFQMPIELQQSGYIGSISYHLQNVNISGENFSDVVRVSEEGKYSIEDDVAELDSAYKKEMGEDDTPAGMAPADEEIEDYHALAREQKEKRRPPCLTALLPTAALMQENLLSMKA